MCQLDFYEFETIKSGGGTRHIATTQTARDALAAIDLAEAEALSGVH